MLITHAFLFSTDSIANNQPSITDGIGDWHGVLKTPNENLTLWLSVISINNF